jgi:hypothetical protein
MSFPKNTDTERGRYLQSILSRSGESVISWQMPIERDFLIVGVIVATYSYIDFHLKRLAEMLDHSGRPGPPWKGKTNEINIAKIAKAVQSANWDPKNLDALRQIEEFRGTRNLLAHCAIKRFPHDDALAFLFKSARDYKDHFGVAPPFGITMTAVADCSQLVAIAHEVENLQAWLSTATLQAEILYQPRTQPNA